MLSKIIFLFALFGFCYGQTKFTVIDTLYDLGTVPGWIVSCGKGYARKPEEFSCGGGLFPIKVVVPEGDITNQVGFWTGCSEKCSLTYTVNELDVKFTLSAYFSDMDLPIIKNGAVQEIVKGTKWLNATVDLAFTKTIEIQLQTIKRGAYVILDKISIERDSTH